ncbi:glycosyltransferase family 4 protein [Flavobacterium sp. H122]|uniref:glycosyltransferase family 4 protein n=1 Tax=Flavobacterium sp. H122 TaxID=2529860 RepID=UPI0010AAFC7D|nr:glycosyltransferase family 4 protein [Flavobacterium sp. H122]
MEQNKKIHIISFDNPYPPVYGGIIEVYYKLIALREIGLKIHLHCFVDEIPADEIPELKNIVEKLYFYKKKKNIISLFSTLPLSVIIRKSNTLVKRLNEDLFPVLFESLKTTAVLNDSRLKQRKFYLRLHNIEENYFDGLAKKESNFINKGLFKIEAKKYSRYKEIFQKTDKIFTISNYETALLKQLNLKCDFIPVFSGNYLIKSKAGRGDYCLYHGDLRTSDNQEAVFFLLKAFEKNDDKKLIIASGYLPNKIKKEIERLKNVNHVLIESNEQLENLIINAHIHLLFSFQNSGTKLKIINALFKGRHIVCNRNMIDDEEILKFCHLVDNENELIRIVDNLLKEPYVSNEIRNSYLMEEYCDLKNAKRLQKEISMI